MQKVDGFLCFCLNGLEDEDPLIYGVYIYLSAYARQPARGPTMWPILWLCWPMLVYLAGNVGPSCGYVGLCWPQVDSC